jgi:hypothetical protein
MWLSLTALTTPNGFPRAEWVREPVFSCGLGSFGKFLAKIQYRKVQNGDKFSVSQRNGCRTLRACGVGQG